MSRPKGGEGASDYVSDVLGMYPRVSRAHCTELEDRDEH